MNLNRRLLSARPVAIDVAMSFLFLVCVVSAGAQTSRIGATLQGTVTDSSGAVVPDVKVILRNTLTNQGRTVATDERGFFRAEALVVGTYEVRAEQAGCTLSARWRSSRSRADDILRHRTCPGFSIGGSNGERTAVDDRHISDLSSLVDRPGKNRRAAGPKPQLSRFRTSFTGRVERSCRVRGHTPGRQRFHIRRSAHAKQQRLHRWPR